MKTNLYYIDCITNLHVGSGDINFNIVDKEVEKDPINGYPIIHASGIKGALRDHAESNGVSEAVINAVFGAPCREDELGNAGSYRFFNAEMLFRPMRAAGAAPFVNVTTLKMADSFKSVCETFSLKLPEGLENFCESDLSFNAPFLVSNAGLNTVEGDEVAALDAAQVSVLKTAMAGKDFAVAKTLDGYELPVIARNNLRIASGGLWYEEYVPRGSRFYMLVLTPDDDTDIDKVIPEIAQIGGNCSIGYGYCRFTKVI